VSHVTIIVTEILVGLWIWYSVIPSLGLIQKEKKSMRGAFFTIFLVLGLLASIS